MNARSMTVIGLFLFCIFAGCGKDQPIDVAKKFWGALEDQDIEKARSYATEATAPSLKMNYRGEDEEIAVIFGEVTESDGQTLVETTVQTVKGQENTRVPMKTVLVKEDDRWKVDVAQTFMSPFGDAMGKMMQGMMEAMQEGMNEMVESMQRKMQESMDEMGESFERTDDNKI